MCAVNEDEVVQKASSEGSGDSSLFSSALKHINSGEARSDNFGIAPWLTCLTVAGRSRLSSTMDRLTRKS